MAHWTLDVRTKAGLIVQALWLKTPEGRLDHLKLCATAVIVHWGDPIPTIEAASRYYDEGHFSKIVIVANDLQECPSALLDTAVSWIIPPRNLGFGGGCNFGARQYPASKYAFLNSDVTFNRDAISMCLDALNIPGVGISAPTLYLPNGNLQSGCGTLSRYMKIARTDIMPIEPINECVWVTGASIFCRHEVFESVGFDGSYFLGYEDLDIGYRARLAGWKVVLIAGASAIHPARTTLKGARPVYYGIRNQIWFTRRFGSFLGSVGATLYMLRIVPRVLLADVVKERSPHTPLIYRGLIAGWRTIPRAGDPLPDEPIPSRWIDWRRD
jgi:N-acetylglucosaminyl-diphospho-decaprenol L-rhamnosyltransferase